ncbi:hypothetical protein BH11PLA1_BH11PLA1_21820 [soil metagenome]
MICPRHAAGQLRGCVGRIETAGEKPDAGGVIALILHHDPTAAQSLGDEIRAHWPDDTCKPPTTVCRTPADIEQMSLSVSAALSVAILVAPWGDIPEATVKTLTRLGLPLIVIASLDRARREFIARALSRLQEGAPPPTLLLDADISAPALAAAAAAFAAARGPLRTLTLHAKIAEAGAAAAGAMIHRVESEVHAAAALQRELLPTVLPVVAGLEMAAVFRPAATLSGDALVVTQPDEHHLAILVADAAGHGLPAALGLMLITRLLHAEGPAALDPALALSHLNDALIHRRGETNLLVTAAYCVIDLRDFSLRCSVAGHPPPTIRAGNGVIELDQGGPPLGACAGFEYGATAAALGMDANLIFTTDGLEHALPPASEAVALRVLAERAGTVGVHHAAAEFEHNLAGQRGSLHALDDVTLLIVQRRDTGLERRATRAVPRTTWA